MSEWKITRRRGVCSACERPFEDGERLVSTLRTSPEGFERAELCLAWWSRRPADARGDACRAACEARLAAPADLPVPVQVSAEPAEPAAEAIEAVPEAPTPASGSGGATGLCWWFSRHAVAPKKTVQLDLESLERLFHDLEGHEEVQARELRYVLCLLLLRKRRLKVDKVERGPEGESFVVHRPRREEAIRVFVYDFSPERMAEVRAELQAIFDGAEVVPGEGAGDGAAAEVDVVEGSSDASAEESSDEDPVEISDEIPDGADALEVAREETPVGPEVDG